MPSSSLIVRASVATIISLIIIPWLITDPHWRNVLLGFVGLYVLYVMTEQDEMLTSGKKAILITGEVPDNEEYKKGICLTNIIYILIFFQINVD